MAGGLECDFYSPFQTKPWHDSVVSPVLKCLMLKGRGALRGCWEPTGQAAPAELKANLFITKRDIKPHQGTGIIGTTTIWIKGLLCCHCIV